MENIVISDTVAILPSELVNDDDPLQQQAAVPSKLAGEEGAAEDLSIVTVPSESAKTDLTEVTIEKAPIAVAVPGVPTSSRDKLVLQNQPKNTCLFHVACLAMVCFWPVGYFALLNAALSRSAAYHGHAPAANVHARQSRRAAFGAISLGSLLVIAITLSMTFGPG